MGKAPLPGYPGWSFEEVERPFVPDVELIEDMWREGRSLFFRSGVREFDQDIYVVACLDEFINDPNDTRVNAFLNRQREKVVRRIRATRVITGGFLAAMERLCVELRPRAVGA